MTIQIYSENAGKSCIQLNSIKVDNDAGIWQGDYFAEIPIYMKVIEADDSSFLKWIFIENGEVVENNNQSIIVYPKSGMKIKAVYQRK